jgi:3',5'-cyclic AMP phosphodiesterase CpdA
MTTARIANAAGRVVSRRGCPVEKPPGMHMALLDAGAGRLAELLVIACLGEERKHQRQKEANCPMPDQTLLFHQETFRTIQNYLSVPYVLFLFVCCYQHVRLCSLSGPVYLPTFFCPVVAPQTRKSPHLPSTVVVPALHDFSAGWCEKQTDLCQSRCERVWMALVYIGRHGTE